MLQNFIHFIKYNNATVIILALILILGGGALAAGPEAIGQKQTTVQGLDNTVLLQADLDAFNMDFKIENIEQDGQYYYATYSFMDIAVVNNAWQYQLSQRTQKISKKIKDDLGVYLAKFLAKHYEARVRELKQERSLAESQGEQKRIEVTEYSGLIGRTLDLAAAVFPGYEAVKKVELPAPDFNAPLPTSPASSLAGEGNKGADNLTKIYNDYVAAHPEIFNPLDVSPAGADASSTPVQPDVSASSTPPQTDTTATTTSPNESTTVDIIDLPDEPTGSPSVVEPALESTPAPEPASTPTVEPAAGE